jgi:tetratricopeptide (TPR) repeat protein
LAAASRAYRRAGDFGKAIAVAKHVTRARSPLPVAAALRSRLLLEMADGYFELAMYERAASHYERFAASDPAAPASAAARRRAARLRFGLGPPEATAETEAHGATPSRPTAVIDLFTAAAVRSMAADDRWSKAADRFVAASR